MTPLDQIMAKGGASASPEAEDAPIVETPQAVEPDTDIDDGADDEQSAAPQEKKPSRYVPKQALDEARREAREAKERALELQKRFDQYLSQAQYQQQQQYTPQAPAEAPDFYEDPTAAVNHHLTPLQRELADLREDAWRMRAEKRYGDEIVDAAEKALKALPREQSQVLARSFMQQSNPYVAMAEWHKTESMRQKFGDDPESFIEQEVARRLAAANVSPTNPQQRAPAPGNMPSNFASGRSATTQSSRGAPGGPLPLSEIMKR